MAATSSRVGAGSRSTMPRRAQALSPRGRNSGGSQRSAAALSALTGRLPAQHRRGRAPARACRSVGCASGSAGQCAGSARGRRCPGWDGSRRRPRTLTTGSPSTDRKVSSSGFAASRRRKVLAARRAERARLSAMPGSISPRIGASSVWPSTNTVSTKAADGLHPALRNAVRVRARRVAGQHLRQGPAELAHRPAPRGRPRPPSSGRGRTEGRWAGAPRPAPPRSRPRAPPRA